MTVSAAMILEVRRKTDEPSATSSYDDSEITTIIEKYPLIDERGEEPYTWDTSTQPPTKDDNEDWISTYDLNNAAADIWEEKAGPKAQDFDFKADGGDYKRSQAYDQAMKQARFFRSKRSIKVISSVPFPQGEDPGIAFNVNDPQI